MEGDRGASETGERRERGSDWKERERTDRDRGNRYMYRMSRPFKLSCPFL